MSLNYFQHTAFWSTETFWISHLIAENYQPWSIFVAIFGGLLYARYGILPATNAYNRLPGKYRIGIFRLGFLFLIVLFSYAAMKVFFLLIESA